MSIDIYSMLDKEGNEKKIDMVYYVNLGQLSVFYFDDKDNILSENDYIMSLEDAKEWCYELDAHFMIDDETKEE